MNDEMKTDLAPAMFAMLRRRGMLDEQGTTSVGTAALKVPGGVAQKPT